MSHLTCSDTTDHLVDSLRRFLSDNNIIMAKNTTINMHEIQETQMGNPITYEVVLKTEVTLLGSTNNHDHDSGIGSSSPSISSTAHSDSAMDRGYSDAEVFGGAETSPDLVSQYSPLFSPEQIDYVSFPDDLNPNGSLTPLPPPESQPSNSKNFPQLLREVWTCNDAGSSHLSASTDLEPMSGDIPISFNFGNLHDDVDMTTSTLAKTCQWPPESLTLQRQDEEHSHQTSFNNEKTGPKPNKRTSRAPSAGNGDSSLSAKQPTFPGSIRTSEDQTSAKKTEMSVISAARSILRIDYLEYLEAELPRWAKGALWDQHEPGGSDKSQPFTADCHHYHDLQIAYADVCQLHTRMEDDVIRSRMALIRLHLEYLRTCEGWQTRQGKGRRIGRGDATCIIDHILRKTHRDWARLSKAQCGTLRARFHERKRYGKRWAVLADGLGKSILFLCSPKVAAIVCNTTVTLKLLGELVDQVRCYGGEVMSFLDYMKPLADSLYGGESLSVHEVEFILDKVRYYRSSITK